MEDFFAHLLVEITLAVCSSNCQVVDLPAKLQESQAQVQQVKTERAEKYPAPAPTASVSTALNEKETTK